MYQNLTRLPLKLYCGRTICLRWSLPRKRHVLNCTLIFSDSIVSRLSRRSEFQRKCNRFLAKDRRTCGWAIVLTLLFGVSAAAQQPLLSPNIVTPTETAPVPVPAGNPAPAANSLPTGNEAATGKVETPSKEASSPDESSPGNETMPVKSLFFTQDEMATVHRALTIYAKYAANPNSNEGEDFLKQLEGKKKIVSQKQQKVNYTYPQFFLESLAYHSPDDWTIRINHQRISIKTPPDSSAAIRVLEIDKDKVTIEWKPDEMDLTKIAEIPSKVPDERVDIDRTNGIIVFTLHANQTFSAYAMRVLEGKVLPVTVKNALADSGAAAPKSEEPPPSPVSPVPRVGVHEHNGLSGLINSYKTLDQEP